MTTPTKQAMQKALSEIEKHVTRAEETLALDHGRALPNLGANSAWAYDLGQLESSVRFIRDALAALADREG